MHLGAKSHQFSVRGLHILQDTPLSVARPEARALLGDECDRENSDGPKFRLQRFPPRPFCVLSTRP